MQKTSTHWGIVICFVIFQFNTYAQGVAYSVKSGLTVGFQRWDNYANRSPLYKYHVAGTIESLAGETNQFSLFAQFGYHQKGSALRSQSATNLSGNIFKLARQEFVFKNLSLMLGGKRKYGNSEGLQYYYLFGLRGDYTIGTNLSDYKELNNTYPGSYPLEGFVRKFNYGVSAGGGLEFPISSLISCLLEVVVSPDFSYQYQQPAIPNVRYPWSTNSVTVPERKIINTVLEISLGLRFINMVEYVD